MTGRPRVIVDTREQTPWRFSSNVDVEVASLPTGDYSLAGATDRVAIERKSLPDLVACCGPERERFLDCCRRLRDYDLRAVVVEAALDDVLAHVYRSRMAPQSVVGTTIALLVDYSVPTIWAGDAKNAANLVERMLTRVWRKRMEGESNE
jgi:ERCC4-type nuclease